MMHSTWRSLVAGTVVLALGSCATGGGGAGWTTLIDGTKGMENFTKVVTDPNIAGPFLGTLVWNFAFAIGSTGFTFVLGMICALALHSPRVRGKNLYRVLLIVPWAIPAFVATFAWKFIYDRDYGIINAVLAALGQQRIDFFDTTAKSLTAVIIVNIWLGVPFMMVALLGGLQAVPGELYEAAEMDGATPWQRFVNVTLPSLRPVSASVILLGTIWTFNMFPIIYLMSNGGPAGTTDILVTGAYKAAFTGIRDYSLAATYGVLILSILIVYSIGYRYFLRKQGEVW